VTIDSVVHDLRHGSVRLDADLLLGRLPDVDAARRLNRAIHLSVAALDLAPDEPLPALARAATLVAQGRPDDACALLSLAPDGLGTRPVGLAVRAFAELRAGRPERAEPVLRRAEAARADVELLRDARRVLAG
jgi:predicted Zn-dependent protease